MAIPRTAGRMFLLDPSDRVLLVHERKDLDPAAPSHWITPGGGVEGNESLVECAIREVHEETGLLVPLAPEASPVFELFTRFTFAGQTYDQTDHFFLAFVDTEVAVVPAAHTETERQVVLGHRWWPLAEIAASGEVFDPADIVEIITSARAGVRRAGGASRAIRESSP